MHSQNIRHFIIIPEHGEEPERLSNKTNLIICVRTQMWPGFNIYSDASVHTKSTLALPLKTSFKNNLMKINELMLKHGEPNC